MAELSSEELEKIVKEEDNSIKPMKEFESPEKLYQELIASVRKYHPSTDISLIEKAYNIAYEAHKGQVRKSGEPYIIHPLCVAIILAELELSLIHIFDIYLPDFKYMSPGLSKKYSHAPDYAEVAKAAIAEMVRQTGKAVFVNGDEDNRCV